MGNQALSISVCLVSAMSEIVSAAVGGHRTLCRRLHRIVQRGAVSSL